MVKPIILISFFLPELFKRPEASSRLDMPPFNKCRPGWETMGPDNKGQMPGVISSSGRYWSEQRRFLLKNLKDFGFGRSSMESLIQEEMVKLCAKLSKLPEVGLINNTMV